jgi:hypothetical protein
MTSGYGRDAWGLDSVSTTRFASGRTLVAQALYRRFTTTRGTKRRAGSPTSYGYDIAELVGAVGYDRALAILPIALRAEACKDDRVQDATAVIKRSNNGDGTVSLIVALDVLLVNERETFALTLAVAGGTTSLVGALP